MTSDATYTTSGASMTLTPGQTILINGKRHVVREVFADTFTADLDTRNHQTRRVDRAKARAALRAALRPTDTGRE
jgi:hypothetical protein